MPHPFFNKNMVNFGQKTSRLSAMANEAEDVWGVFHVLYMSLMLALFKRWELKKCTVSDMDTTLKYLKKRCAGKKEIKKLMSEFEEWDSAQSRGSQSQSGIGRGSGGGGGESEFTNLEKL